MAGLRAHALAIGVHLEGCVLRAEIEGPRGVHRPKVLLRRGATDQKRSPPASGWETGPRGAVPRSPGACTTGTRADCWIADWIAGPTTFSLWSSAVSPPGPRSPPAGPS